MSRLRTAPSESFAYRPAGPAAPRRTPNGKLPDGVDLRRLCDAVARDRRELAPFRRNRLEMVRQYAGARYGDNAAAAEVPVNLLGLYGTVIPQAVVSDTIRVMLSTFDEGKRATVDAMEAWVNDELVRMNVTEAYRRIVYDALFWVGIGKVALATPADAAAQAWDVEAGQPFIEAIDPDDFVCDTNARTFGRCSYHGCRYRLPVSLANELYAKGRAEKFEADDREDMNDGGDDRIHTLTATGRWTEQLEDECDLWEIYIARHKLIVTLRDSGGLPDYSREPVRVQQWVGPSSGPYHFLSLGVVPGNLQPKAPVMDLFPLALMHSNLYRKLARRTRDTKTVNTFDGRSADDAARFQKAADGEFIQVGDVNGIKQLESGGPTNDLVVMGDHVKAMFELVGGNLSVIGGRSTEARTLGQEKILNENAAGGIAAISTAYLGFVQGTVESLLWYAHHHPTKVMESSFSVPSMPGPGVARRVYPAGGPAPAGAMRRTGPPPDIKIDPYSLPRQTPQSRLAFITQTVTTLAPLMQLLAQQGKLPDMDVLLSLMAKYGNEPDLVKVFGLTVPPPPGGGSGGGGGEGTMPAQTERTYNRVSSGGQGPQAAAADLTQNVARMQGPANPNGGGGQ